MIENDPGSAYVSADMSEGDLVDPEAVGELRHQSAVSQLRDLADRLDSADMVAAGGIRKLQEEIERLKAQLLTAIQMKNATPPAGLLTDMRQLAKAQDMEVPEWVFEQLRIIVDEKAGRVGMIPVEAAIYEKFRSIAKGRGVPLDYVTAKEGFTNFIKDGFDNYRL